MQKLSEAFKGGFFFQNQKRICQNKVKFQLLKIIILLQEKFLQFDWLRAVVFQLNLKYLHVKITNLWRVVVYINNSRICA